jgi:hypothetical protein
MKTNLMTYLAHCHDPSQPYEIIDEHADYHYELSSSNFNLINMPSQASPGMATFVTTAVEQIQPGWTRTAGFTILPWLRFVPQTSPYHPACEALADFHPSSNVNAIFFLHTH